METVFTIKFEADEGKGRQADIRAIGASLSNLADAIEKAYAVTNNTSIDFNFNIAKHSVNSDEFEIVMTAAGAIGPLLPEIARVEPVLQTIGFIKDYGVSLLDFLRWKQENPEHKARRVENGSVRIEAPNSEITVNNIIVDMANSSNVIDKLCLGLERPLDNGVGRITVSTPENTGIPHTKYNTPKIVQVDLLGAEPMINKVKKWFIVTRPNLDKGTDLYLKDRDTNKEKKIQVNDEDFVKEILAGKVFGHGDMLLVDLLEEQFFDNHGKLQSRLSIEKVHEHHRTVKLKQLKL